LLGSEPAVAVVAQVAGDSELAESIRVYQPSVLLWDLGWESGALDRLTELNDGLPPVVALLRDEAAALEVWAAGARGLLRRDMQPRLLVGALIAAARGLITLDPALARALIPLRERVITPLTEDLTPRELDVLHLMAEGLPNKVIAQRLNISEHTVKFHINAILGKLGAQSRTDAVVRATRSGLLML
jgi:DNA-binding NarL/FixJ family response regulator